MYLFEAPSSFCDQQFEEVSACLVGGKKCQELKACLPEVVFTGGLGGLVQQVFAEIEIDFNFLLSAKMIHLSISSHKVVPHS